jgi:GrpE
MSHEPPPAADATSRLFAVLDEISSGLDRLRKSVLRHGQAQELFQQRVDEKVDALAAALVGADTANGDRSGRAVAGAAEAAGTAAAGDGAAGDGAADRPRLGHAQLRALLELDKAVLAMHRATRDGETSRDEDAPASLREGLDLLHIRIRNLQRSFGLEPIATVGRPFDDRLHRVESTCSRWDLAPGLIVTELLPGYRLDGEVLRPALVVVNLLAAEASEER